MADLAGATTEGEPFAWPKDAGEFAARWNATLPMERDKLVEIMVRNAQEATMCFVANHKGELEQAQDALRRLAADNQYFRDSPNLAFYHQGLKDRKTVEKIKLILNNFRVLSGQEIGGVTLFGADEYADVELAEKALRELFTAIEEEV